MSYHEYDILGSQIVAEDRPREPTPSDVSDGTDEALEDHIVEASTPSSLPQTRAYYSQHSVNGGTGHYSKNCEWNHSCVVVPAKHRFERKANSKGGIATTMSEIGNDSVATGTNGNLPWLEVDCLERRSSEDVAQGLLLSGVEYIDLDTYEDDYFVKRLAEIHDHQQTIGDVIKEESVDGEDDCVITSIKERRVDTLIKTEEIEKDTRHEQHSSKHSSYNLDDTSFTHSNIFNISSPTNVPSDTSHAKTGVIPNTIKLRKMFSNIQKADCGRAKSREVEMEQSCLIQTVDTAQPLQAVPKYRRGLFSGFDPCQPDDCGSNLSPSAQLNIPPKLQNASNTSNSSSPQPTQTNGNSDGSGTNHKSKLFLPKLSMSNLPDSGPKPSTQASKTFNESDNNIGSSLSVPTALSLAEAAIVTDHEIQRNHAAGDLDTNMRDLEEIDWNHQGEDEGEDSDWEAECSRLYARNNRLASSGTIRLCDEVELRYAKRRRAEARRRIHGDKVPQDLILSDADPLFIPESSSARGRLKKPTDREIHMRMRSPSRPPPLPSSFIEDGIDEDGMAEALGCRIPQQSQVQERRPDGNGASDYDDFDQNLIQSMAKDITAASKTKRNKGKSAKELHQRVKRRANGGQISATNVTKVSKGPVATKGVGRGKIPADNSNKGKGKGKAAQATASGNTKASRKSSKKQALTQKARPKRNVLADDRTVNNLLIHLVTNDAIADRIAQGTPEEEPEVTTRNKDRMLKDLIASVPRELRDNSDKKNLLSASKAFGRGKVKIENGKWLLKGMRTPLYHHQLLGANWMVRRELSDSRPYGGILADSMGLGKTLQILALMCGNLPNLENGCDRRPTLLVLPSAIISQWQEEIRLHLNDGVFPRVLHYRASTELKKEFLELSDIIVTSYGEVCRSFPYPKKEDLKALTFDMLQGWIKKNWPERGTLHRLKYYRVVLDEAHAIKNYKSQTSLACQSLRSQYRWAVTATPIQNNLDELYPYFKFLNLEYAKEFHEFKDRFCNPYDQDCVNRAVTCLSFIMMRRTIADKMFNRPIVSLPPVHAETIRLDFSQGERALYSILEERFRRDLNKHLRLGTAGKNYGTIMVMLLRLRQCTSHPFLLKQTIKDTFSLEDLRRLEEQSRNNGDLRPLFEQIGQWRIDAENLSGASEEPENAAQPPQNNFGRGSYGNSFDLKKYLDTLDERDMLERCICRLCLDFADNATITSCKHVFCRECLENESNTRAREAVDDFHLVCPYCESLLNSVEPCKELEARRLDDDEISDEEVGDGEPGLSQRSRRPKAKRESWVNMVGEMLPSAKTIALKSKLLSWFYADPTTKVVIFVQFRLMIDILRKILQDEKIGSCTYHGDMNQKTRHANVKKFHEDPNVKVMIAGLKCGGQGLNLTCANKVISLDLWWNHSVEKQAFGRIFRIGQRRETEFIRYAVKGTVDDRLLGMQAEKIRVIERAMCDNPAKPRKRLSVDELAKLFGYLTKGPDGEPVILSDSDDTEDGE